MADLLKWYGSKEKAMKAIIHSTGNTKEMKLEQDENIKIYNQFMTAKKTDNAELAHNAVEMLAEAADSQFEKGCSEFVAHAIRHYYGV